MKLWNSDRFKFNTVWKTFWYSTVVLKWLKFNQADWNFVIAFVSVIEVTLQSDEQPYCVVVGYPQSHRGRIRNLPHKTCPCKRTLSICAECNFIGRVPILTWRPAKCNWSERSSASLLNVSCCRKQLKLSTQWRFVSRGSLNRNELPWRCYMYATFLRC